MTVSSRCGRRKAALHRSDNHNALLGNCRNEMAISRPVARPAQAHGAPCHTGYAVQAERSRKCSAEVDVVEMHAMPFG